MNTIQKYPSEVIEIHNEILEESDKAVDSLLFKINILKAHDEANDTIVINEKMN